jgi:hypothetical protein
LILTTLDTLKTTATQQFLGEYTGYFDAATCTPASVAKLAKANIKFAIDMIEFEKAKSLLMEQRATGSLPQKKNTYGAWK